MASESEIAEEARKVRRLQIVIDLVRCVLRQPDLSAEEASELIAAVRQYALRQFPGREQTYEILYGRRFQKLLAERFKVV